MLNSQRTPKSYLERYIGAVTKVKSEAVIKGLNCTFYLFVQEVGAFSHLLYSRRKNETWKNKP